MPSVWGMILQWGTHVGLVNPVSEWWDWELCIMPSAWGMILQWGTLVGLVDPVSEWWDWVLYYAKCLGHDTSVRHTCRTGRPSVRMMGLGVVLCQVSGAWYFSEAHMQDWSTQCQNDLTGCCIMPSVWGMILQRGKHVGLVDPVSEWWDWVLYYAKCLGHDTSVRHTCRTGRSSVRMMGLGVVLCQVSGAWYFSEAHM